MTAGPIIDLRAARDALLARYRDEHNQPAGTEAIRCTAHGRFIAWCSPPAPPCTVACPPACGTSGHQA